MRVDQVNSELIQSMKKAGCVFIIFGVESGSQRILKMINKRVTVKKIEKACTNHNLIVFPHPRDHETKYIKYASLVELKDRAMYYFSASDLLISDFSSIIIDYCFFNKPIIQVTDTIDRNIRRHKNIIAIWYYGSV